MQFLEPIRATCPGCAATSEHSLESWLAPSISCPACGSSLAQLALPTKQSIDDWAAIQVWAEVSIEVEERLGINTPGIEDGALCRSKRPVGFTLRDLVSLLMEQYPVQVQAAGGATTCVRAAAESVTQQPVSVSDFDQPLLRVLQLPGWDRRYG